MAKRHFRPSEVRISYLFMQPFETRLESAVSAYRRLARRLLVERRPSDPFSLPWNTPEAVAAHLEAHPQDDPRHPLSPAAIGAIEPFWLSLIGRSRREPMDASTFGEAEAMGCLLPLRLIRHEPIEVGDENLRVSSWVERFFLPLAVATVLTLRIRSRSDSARLEHAIWPMVDFSTKFFPRLEAGNSGPAGRIRRVLAVALDEFPLATVESSVGASLGRLRPAGKPVVVTTVIHAPRPEERETEMVQLALLGFCSQNPTWRRILDLGSFERHLKTFPSRNRQPSRGCHFDGNLATWLSPGSIREKAIKVLSFSRYHRHQCFAALQVRAGVAALSKLELLHRCGLNGDAAGRSGWRAAFWRAWRRVDPGELAFRLQHRPWLMRVAQLLGRLYGGQDTAYKTWTNHDYIRQSETAGLINSVRERFVQPPLFSKRLDEVKQPVAAADAAPTPADY